MRAPPATLSQAWWWILRGARPRAGFYELHFYLMWGVNRTNLQNYAGKRARARCQASSGYSLQFVGHRESGP